MKKIMALSVVVMMLMMAGSALAGMRGTDDVVKVSATNENLSAAAGARLEFEINLDITKKWHIYAHGDSNFIGVDLTPEESFPLTNLETVYPHGHEGEFFGEKVIMIEGKDVIKVSATVPANLVKGKHTLGFSITAQACDDKSCLAPAELPVSFTLMVK